MLGRLRNDDGFSLIELLVATSVGTVVVLAAFTVLDMSISTQSTATSRVETVQRGRETMNEIGRVLRSHTCLGDGTDRAFVEATRTSVRLHSAIGPERLVPGFQRIHDRRIVFGPAARTVTVQQYNGNDAPTPAATTFSGTVSSSRVVGERIRLDGTTPIFRYYTFGSAVPITPSVELDPGAGALSDDQLKRIVRIDVRFVVRTNDNAASTKYSLFTSRFWIRSADPAAASKMAGCT